MSEAEHPIRRSADHSVTLDDVRQLMGASTPHFALQLRERIRRLIAGLPADDPARQLGEHEIARLNRLAVTGEVRGEGDTEGMPPLPSLGIDEPTPSAAGRVPGEQASGHDPTASNVG